MMSECKHDWYSHEKGTNRCARCGKVVGHIYITELEAKVKDMEDAFLAEHQCAVDALSREEDLKERVKVLEEEEKKILVMLHTIYDEDLLPKTVGICTEHFNIQGFYGGNVYQCGDCLEKEKNG